MWLRCLVLTITVYTLLHCKMGKQEWVELQIKSNKVVVFSKSYCPYCKLAKKAIEDAGLKKYLVFELDNMDDGSEIQDILLKITGGKTVPRVFVGGEFLGGGDKTSDLQKSGQLTVKFKEVGAL